MLTKYKQIAYEMRLEALQMRLDNRYLKCEEIIQKYANECLKYKSVLLLSPISGSKTVDYIRRIMIRELGEVLDRDMSFLGTEMVLEKTLESVGVQMPGKLIPYFIWTISYTGMDVTEAIGWSAVVGILQDKGRSSSSSSCSTSTWEGYSYATNI